MFKFILPLLIASCFAQTLPTNVSAVSLPTFLAAGGTYNQLLPNVNFWATGIIPIVNSLNMYESTTIDIFPVKATVNAKPVYIFTTSIREGVHKCSDASQLNVFCVGADGGYSFAQTATATTSSGVSAAVTLTYIRHIGKHWAIMAPIRALYMPTLGGWNPVIEVGVAYKP